MNSTRVKLFQIPYVPTALDPMSFLRRIRKHIDCLYVFEPNYDTPDIQEA